MTTSPVLNDVVAYVDVWSSDKTANCSKPFVQQLQEMGAQVTKTFNKQVTHVVFKNGHPATWRKAKKSDVKLVSVLWVSRCYEDGVRGDEELYPALNDDSTVLRNKKHRCMQPKDSPEKTPDNDRRMKKKLDRMMKDLHPKQSIVTEVSPIIIDEENGIVYSPGLKRSDYMARRLKDMKEKHEYLSPTASQMVECRSPTGQKPSLGNTPTVFKLMYDQSDDDSSASAAEPGYSPDKGEGRTKVDATDHDHLEQHRKKTSEKPWLSPCRDVPKRIASPSLKHPNVKDSVTPKKIKSPSLNLSDFRDEEEQIGSRQKKTRLTSGRKKPAVKHASAGLPEKAHQAEGTDSPKNIHKEKKQSRTKLPSPSPDKSEKEKGKLKAAKALTKTKTRSLTDTVNSSSRLSSPVAKLSDAAGKLSKDSPLQKAPKRARQSFSALVQSFTESSDSKTVASCSTDADDSVFEDFFSNTSQQRSQTPVLPTLPVEEELSFQIPFELGSTANKKKQRRSESVASEANSKKKRKLEGGQTGRNRQQPANTSSESRSHPQQDVKESLPPPDTSAASVKPVDKRRRKSTLPVTSTEKTTIRKTRASMSTLPEASTESKQEKNPAASVFSHNLESRGNECTVAAGLKEIPSEGEDNPTKNISSSVQSMVNKTTSMRTLVMTSMPADKQQTVDQVVKSLGGFSIVDRVCESTTHIVSGGHKRTLNILLGIARGCWILSFEWVLWCLEQRQWIPEEPYELSEQFPAAQICRLQRHLSAGEHQQDLFQDHPAMFVSQHSQPPTQSLMELIQLCGGKVCKTVRQAGLCIGKYSGRRPEGSRMLSEQWVLDSITHLKRLLYDDYDLERGGGRS
ncbi:microcephalin isoform X1 [Notolabrus celidotus]|uniref:microcephalin isoform X1 n=1 Tax=Notolabrus celidotus TaxID=1203425 RepID=UPI00148F9147|nr:microcephalin isoform X1 [Notolabrus celidotus]XP_034537569.1 microcephalin isoform X1 [Notolabrus celidotus]